MGVTVSSLGVRTRTLLLLAVGCGLLILVAGTVFLFGLSGQDEVTLLDVGDEATVGDAEVRVVAYDEGGRTATVTIEIGGVDDPDGADEFRLVVAGESLRAGEGVDGAETCDEVTVAAIRCTLSFDVSDAAGGSRILLYRRGDDVARWQLGPLP